MICTASLTSLVLLVVEYLPVLPWLICIPFIANNIFRTLGVWIWTTIIIAVVSTLSYFNMNDII